jgi:hypothetical protein
MRSRALVSAVSTLLLCSGCGTFFHIEGNRVPSSTQPRSVTEAAYLWGAIQPNDIVPPNCPVNVPLAEVTAKTNLGYIFISIVTLGIVVIEDIEWTCAGLPAGQDTNVLGGTPNTTAPNPNQPNGKR